MKKLLLFLHTTLTFPLSIMDITADFLSIGGNRNPAAADWDSESAALLAFGADDSVALWEPQVGLGNQ